MKKLSGILGLIVLSVVLTGCTSTQNSMQAYSIRSYQGPLPMEDYQHINREAYGVPVSPR